jgi:hypothetical protein
MLAVLRCCADDLRSLFSAARAHSRLHQAAVQVTSSIRAVVPQQQHADSVLLYLSNHGQHVHSIDLEGVFGALQRTASLRQLPHGQLQGLSSLKFSKLQLQLLPGDGLEGVFGDALPLKQLKLRSCTFSEDDGLAAALLLLPDLQHLSLVWNSTAEGGYRSSACSTATCSALQGLQHLTYLELADGWLEDEDRPWHLQGVTRLQDLRLETRCGNNISASMLSGLQRLTCLKVISSCNGEQFEPDALTSKTQLQHLEVVACGIPGGSVGIAELLSHLQHLQQLSYLKFQLNYGIGGPGPPAAAYSALTSSSRLQHLEIGYWPVPVGGRLQLFPAGRQLPHLTMLDFGDLDAATVLKGSRLVSCCPALQSLRVTCDHDSSELLGTLTGLSSLCDLGLYHSGGSSPGGLEVVCQLTGLRALDVWDPSEDDGLLQQLTQLKQLTQLNYWCHGDGSPMQVSLHLLAYTHTTWHVTPVAMRLKCACHPSLISKRWDS